jgi:hypothetical protein
MRRAYHFVSLQHGLDDLRRRRLKISRLDDLNDPVSGSWLTGSGFAIDIRD